MKYEVFCLMAAASVLGACSSADSEPEGADADPQLREAMSLPGFVDWRDANVTAMKAGSLSRADLSKAVGTGAVQSGTGATYLLQTKKGNYTIELDVDVMAAANPTSAVEGRPGGEVQARGWSNGFDSRVRNTGTSIRPEVGRIGNCTGTLISERVVRTAAHCIITHTATGGTVPAVGALTFEYRRNGATVAATANDEQRWFGINYISAGCATRTAADYWSGYRANFETCTWSDFGFIVLPNNWWAAAGEVAWMGARIVGNGDQNVQFRSTGYPICGQTNSPINASGCVNGAQYEDRSSSCRIRQWTNGNAKWLSDCDTSGGNSGGPMWEVNGRRLLGHVQWEDCTTCPVGSTNRANPNRFLGYDQALWDFESALIDQNPAF